MGLSTSKLSVPSPAEMACDLDVEDRSPRPAYDRPTVELSKPEHGTEMVSEELGSPVSFHPGTSGLIKKRRMTMRESVRIMLEDPGTSKSGLCIAIFLSLAIVVSVCTFCASTLPVFQRQSFQCVLGHFEMGFNLLFTVELIVRVSVAPTFRHVIRDPFMWFDFLGILPFFGILATRGYDYCENLDEEAGFLPALYSLRVIRLLKLARHFQGSVILAEAIKASLGALTVPYFFLFVATVLFASILYYLEKQSLGEDSAFGSIPHAMWFMVVTMTTVGYGDVAPLSTAGKLITTFAMNFGILFLSMPLAIVGNNFTVVWSEKEQIIFMERLRETSFSQDLNIETVGKFFRSMDLDGSGYLDYREFQSMLAHLKIGLSTQEARRLWHALDDDKSGFVTLEELCQLMLGEQVMKDYRLDQQMEDQQKKLQEGEDDEPSVEDELLELRTALKDMTASMISKIEKLEFRIREENKDRIDYGKKKRRAGISQNNAL